MEVRKRLKRWQSFCNIPTRGNFLVLRFPTFAGLAPGRLKISLILAIKSRQMNNLFQKIEDKYDLEEDTLCRFGEVVVGCSVGAFIGTMAARLLV